ncbi:MAG: alginate export family protein [Ignavibacteriales bacterium]|nr:alginate export family protein [Ignavibacteriales bacterium]
MKPTQDVAVFVQVQDSRLFGGGNSALALGTLDGTAKAVDFHQAFFTVSNLFSSPVSIKIGRQELSYGNERLMGAAGWGNIGRAFDAGVLSYKSGSVDADIFASKLVGSQATIVSQNFRGLYSTWKFFAPHLVDAFVLFDDNTDEVRGGPDATLKKLQRSTAGVLARGKVGQADYEFEAASQGGATALSDTAARASISAYLFSGSGGYTFDIDGKPRVAIRYTVLSGDDDKTDNTVRTFNLLFGTNHKFYGYMDYFPGILPDYGLSFLTFSCGVNVLSNLGVALDFHHFSLDRSAALTIAPGQTAAKQALGDEIDFTTTLKYNPNVSFVFGLSTFFPGDVVKIVKGGSNSYWSCIMTSVNF